MNRTNYETPRCTGFTIPHFLATVFTHNKYLVHPVLKKLMCSVCIQSQATCQLLKLKHIHKMNHLNHWWRHDNTTNLSSGISNLAYLVNIALQTADPSSHQKGCPTERRLQLSDSNVPAGSNIWSQVPEWARHQDILTVSRKVTSTSTSSDQ
jgi:hypothetical protein